MTNDNLIIVLVSIVIAMWLGALTHEMDMRDHCKKFGNADAWTANITCSVN